MAQHFYILYVNSLLYYNIIKFKQINKWYTNDTLKTIEKAIFTNQLLIFGTLCLYGFSVWSTISTTACNASNHLLYGFIILISTSTILILWIGLYQFYAATKYLCTYKAVMDVKKSQLNSNNHLNGNKSNCKLKMNKNGRKFSVESASINMSTVSLSCIHTIYRYGEDNDDNDDNNEEHESIQPSSSILELKINDNQDNINNHRRKHTDEEDNITDIEVDQPSLPPLTKPISPRPSIDGIEPLNEFVTPFNASSENTTLMQQESMHDKLDGNEQEMSESLSESASPSKSTTHIEIAGILIPTQRFTKKGHRKHHKHDHKRYKSIQKNDMKSKAMMEDQHLDDQKELEEVEIEMKSPNSDNNPNDNDDENGDDINRKNQLFAMPVFGKAIKITCSYFDRLKEDPSTADLCIICYESFKSDDYLARLKCHHSFHKNCIRIWLANNHSCPLCNMNEKNLNLKLNITKNS